MTDTSYRRDKRAPCRKTLLIFLCASYISMPFTNGNAFPQKIMDISMPSKDITIWKMIDLISQQVPFTKEKLESVTRRFLSKKTGDGPVISFTGHNVPLADDIFIQKIELRQNPNHPRSGLVVIDVSGRCISVDQLKTNYEKLEITEFPRGKSLDETTTYTSRFVWGAISFGFKEKNPECLSWIVIASSS